MLRLAWLAGAICVGLFLFMLLPALARDPDGRYAGSQYDEWFRSQHNEKGEWCCDKSDGHYYDGSYQFDTDGGVIVELGGKPHKLPSYMVLKHPNPTGRAVWWYLDTTAMGHIDYCFAPGTLG